MRIIGRGDSDHRPRLRERTTFFLTAGRRHFGFAKNDKFRDYDLSALLDRLLVEVGRSISAEQGEKSLFTKSIRYINENYTEIALGLEKNIVSITNEVEKQKQDQKERE